MSLGRRNADLVRSEKVSAVVLYGPGRNIEEIDDLIARMRELQAHQDDPDDGLYRSGTLLGTLDDAILKLRFKRDHILGDLHDSEAARDAV